jgi:hypothetical protein
MKKTVTVEKVLCDACEKEEASTYHPCLKCGKVYCYDCANTHAIDYAHGVHVGGSGDGRYCLPCDTELRKAGDSLHRAYLTVRALRDEERAWYASFSERSKHAEAEVERQRETRPTRQP